MAERKIALIIPVFNGLRFTAACLDGLADKLKFPGSNGAKFTIVVCDDGSTDGTADWISTNHPEVVLLKGDGNLWWSGCINSGTRYAIENLQCDYILWWNNDIEPSEDYFSQLLKIMEQTDVSTIVGSKIYYAGDSSRIWSLGGIFNPRTGQKYMTAMGEPDSDQFNRVYDADWLPGMGSLMHRSVYEKIGYLDNLNFPQYHGDSDFTYRAHLSGFHIKVFPQLKIWNDKSNSGLMHNNSYKMLIRSLHDIKSSYYLKKDLNFYRKYATSALAYQTLAVKYCLYVGGFFKWKFLSLVGVRKGQGKLTKT